MKRSLLVVAVVAAVFVANAQFGKGSILLGGNIGFSHSEAEVTQAKNNSITLSPSFGIAVSNNTFAGLNVLYSHAKYESSTPLGAMTSQLTGGSLFLRRYVALGHGFYVFGEGDLYAQASKNLTFVGTGNNGQKVLQAGIGGYPGIAYSATKHLQLEIGMPNFLTVGYTRSKTIQNDQVIETDKIVNGSIAASGYAYLNLGFRFLIPR